MAIAFATLTPTRRALNPPGPLATKMASTSSIVTLACSIIRRSVGASSTEWFCSERHTTCSATWPLVDRATEAYLVEVSMDSSIG